MRIPEEPRRAAEINIVPLIDVIFCILVFFIMASLVLTRSEGLDVNLPNASAAQPKLQPDATISITEDGTIAVNTETVELDGIIPTINQILESREAGAGKGLVVLNADLAITHGKVVDVMNELRQIEDVSLAIAARRNDDNS
ncbi:MAG: biopolymer transporter ExbD [Cyanobacteria bacterium J06642_2]